MESGKHKFELLISIDNPTSSANLLDFSRNNQYFIYKEINDITVIDLTKLSKTNAIYTDLDIEWSSDGIQITDATKVNYSYL